jgi:hypothetical protein
MNEETAELLGDLNKILEDSLPDMDWRDRAELGLKLVQGVRRWGHKANLMKWDRDPNLETRESYRLHGEDSANVVDFHVLRAVERTPKEIKEFWERHPEGYVED